MQNNDKIEFNEAWNERVYIETTEYIIRGTVFMPKIGKKDRLLTEILNTNKHFLAVTDCVIESKLVPQKEVERFDFIEINLSTVLLMRPIDE